MSLEAKIVELTHAVTTLTAAVVELNLVPAGGMIVQPSAAPTGGAVKTPQEDIEVEVKETPAQKKKRLAKERRDKERQEEIDKETEESAKAEEVEEAAEPEPEEVEVEVVEEAPKEVTPLMLKKVASYLIKSGKKKLWHEALAETGAAKISEVEDRASLLTVLEGIAGSTHDELPDA